MIARAILLLLVGLVLSPLASAHKASTAYLHLSARDRVLEGRIELAVRDLDFAMDLDANRDGEVTWGELKAARGRVADYVRERLSVASAGVRCDLQDKDLKVVPHSDGNYAVLYLAGSCAQAIDRLSVDYRLFFDIDALHRGLLALDLGSGQQHDIQSGLFSPDTHELQFTATESGVSRVFGQYFRAGLVHVWSGLDHLLFLAGLFLPAVLRRVRSQWVAVPDMRTALKDTAFIVTAFTLAHACTLTLAATGAFTLPSRMVESAVALTVLFAGFNNLVPLVYRDLFWLSGLFGLIHGAAVASALIDLGLPGSGRVWALLAFNLGVEAAQLSLLLVVVIPAFAFRHTGFYRKYLLVPGSAAVAFVGACWFVERACGVYFGVPLP
jgi:hydrogenase/urease accessory protein HupE